MQYNFYGWTIGSGETYDFGWYFPDGNMDRNVQVAVAHPLGTATLRTVAQIKTRDQNGYYSYGIRVGNDGPTATGFNVQGSGI